MSHTYLINLYDMIDQRIEEASKELRSGTSDRGGIRFQQGRCEVLTEFKQFLAERYNKKLPRRIRNKYPGESHPCPLNNLK
jgi:hypothetical protein